MSFLGRWLSSAWIMSLSLAAALILMQAPALTDAYMAALLQVASDARADIEQRISSARRYYNLVSEDESQVVDALRQREPSNAETLTLSIERSTTLRATYDRLNSTAPLLRPAVAVIDAAVDPAGYKRNVLRLLFSSFVPALQLSLTGLGYAVAGVLAGSLLAHAILGLLRLATPRRRQPSREWYVPPREPGLQR